MSKEASVQEEEKTDTKEEQDEQKSTSEEKKVLTPEEKKARKKKIIRTSIIAVVIIGLTIGASFLGPANMDPGEPYEVQLTINRSSNEYQISFNIWMNRTADTTPIEIYQELDSSYTVLIFTDSAYRSSTNSKVAFKVGLLDGLNNSIENISLSEFNSKIVGPNMDRELRPIDSSTAYSSILEEEVEVVLFSMAVPYKTGIAMSLLVLIAGLWISEIVPTIVGSFLVPIIVAVSGITSAGDALQPFFDPVIALFFGGFIIAEALKKHNIDKRFALGIVSNASVRPSVLILILMGVSAFLSMWMSNTASAAVMIPIAIAMVDQIKKCDTKCDIGGFRKALVLGIGYAATTGGIASVIGTPANPIAIAGLSKIGIEISFLKWFAFGLPFVLIMLFIIWGYLLAVFRPKVQKKSLNEAQITFKEELKKLGKMGKKEWLTVGIFVFTIVLWLSATFINDAAKGAINLSSGIIALIAVILIMGTNILKPRDVKNINWNALFLFGGGLSLGNALVSTGIGDWIASNMGVIQGRHYIVIALIVGGISLLVTAVASNTASAAMLIPLVIPIAVSLQIDPILLAVIVAIGSSVDYALVFGTPPTMISYSTGYFSVKEIFRIGSILDIIGILLLSTISVLLWVGFGLVMV